MKKKPDLKAARKILEREFQQQFGEAVPVMGVMPSPIDDEFRESLEIANQLKEKMKIN